MLARYGLCDVACHAFELQGELGEEQVLLECIDLATEKMLMTAMDSITWIAARPVRLGHRWAAR